MTTLAEAAESVIADLKATKNALVASYQDTLFDIGDSLVFFTPLKTGLASSNWNVSTGQKPTEREVLTGVKGTASLKAMRTQVKSITAGSTAIFSNPVEYIGDLEAGSSPQARAGMVTPTLTRIEGFWLENLRSYGILE